MASSNTSALSTPVFNGENYQVWAVKMKAYLRGLGLWQWVETERQIQPLGNNPTLIKSGLMKKKKLKLQELYLTSMLLVSEPIFTRIMACETPKEAWEKLKEMYLGSEEEESNEDAFLALQKRKASQGREKKQSGEKKDKEKNEGQGRKSGVKRRYPPCPHCKKQSHSENFCWYRPSVQCRSCKQFGHVEKVSKNKNDQQGKQGQQTQMAENQQQQEQLFIVTSHATSSCTKTWLIDSGCTNHMTPELSYFKELDKSYKSKVKIGNGDLVDVKARELLLLRL
ncbi:hypothetical protein CK203_014409 [Vitis vinifera]|uniref:Uncharacterized protein n=1 Tax=Vitis vinifera TaxID=29760 RepID=A0A438K588_VITVI|nr:hypothetical protein CK203_014409 [Vitis vinifera]